MFWRAFTLLALWLGLAVPAMAVASDVVVLPGHAGSVRVTGVVDYIIEPSADTDFTVQQAAASTQWKRYQGRQVNLSRQFAPVWLRFQIENRSERTEWLLSVPHPLLDHLRFHQLDEQGRLVAWRDSGLLAPAATRGNDTDYDFAMSLPKGGKTTVLIRLQSTTALIVPMTMWDRDAYKSDRLAHNFVMGLLFGVLAIMLIYNASLFIFTRDNSYFAYSAYLAAAAFYELALTGYGPLFLWGDNAWLTWRGYELTACLAFLSATLFFRVFLDLRNCNIRHLVWLNNGFLTVWVAATVLTLVQNSPWVSLSIALLGLLGGVAAVYSSVYRIFQGSISARYFAIAWSTLLVGTTVHIVSLFGGIEGNWVTDYGQHLGFVIEIMLLSLALADRIKRERAARERAQAEAMSLTEKVQSEREEKIRAQEQAIEIQTRAKEELELRVLDRTAELERAMKNLEIANVELAKLSVTDALTKVHNRRYFDDVLKREHDRSSRTGVPLALALVDIDHFKKINDSCGHLAGDECLRLVAHTLAQTVGRSTDLVARYGGEEFALVLPGTGPEQAAEMAERVRAAVAGIDFIYRGKRVPVSVSLGVVARVTTADESVADFIAEADAALYRAKDAGRNRVMLAA